MILLIDNYDCSPANLVAVREIDLTLQMHVARNDHRSRPTRSHQPFHRHPAGTVYAAREAGVSMPC